MDHDDFADFLLHEDIPRNKIITDIPQRSRSWIEGYNQKSSKPPIFVKQNTSWFENRDT
jgi:hypothetical protein